MSLSLKLFYSWQSDAPRAICKDLIRGALDDAVKQESEDLMLEQAERPEVDQDTQGVLGAPSIADTILEKIKAADLVVPDVTLTGRAIVGHKDGEEPKAFLNSNVAIEVGSALNGPGSTALLLVMNTHYGKPEQLPFDLKHRRFPTTFELAPGADAKMRAKVQAELAKKFANIIGEYVKAKAPPPAAFERTMCNGNAAVYWRQGDALVERKGERFSARINEPLLYLRLSPVAAVAPFSGVQIADKKFTYVRPLMYEAEGVCADRNDQGMIFYVRPEDEDDELPELLAWTQVFKNREIWGVNALQLHSNSRKLVNMDYVERDLIEGLREYLKKAEEFDYGVMVQFEAGLVHVKGMRLRVPNAGQSDPLREFNITHSERFNRRDPAAWKKPLLTLFEKIFDEGSQVRPKDFRGFPGGD